MSENADDRPHPRAQPELFGHDAAMEVLARGLRASRLAHAWLVTGPRGVGKATLAYRFARSYLAPPEAGPVVHRPEHPVFRKVRAGSHEDLVTVEPRQAKRGATMQKVEVVRELLAGLHRTSIDGRRVCLIDEADVTLNAQGENALLKLLEEPPRGLIFLLITQRPGALLPTIASRCARLRLAPLSDDLVVQGLLSIRPALAEEAAAELAALAGGSIGRALELEALDWVGAYAAVLAALADEGRNDAADLRASAVLGQVIEAETHRGAADLLAVALRRAVVTGCGRPPRRALYPAEPESLRRIATRAPPSRLLDLAVDLAALSGRVDGLNLDPLQALVQIVHGVRHPEAARIASLA